jgi:DENN (AEX-3) domain
MSSRGVDADIERLRHKLRTLEQERAEQKKSSRRVVLATMSSRKRSIDAFQHLSTSTRNLGQRQSSFTRFGSGTNRRTSRTITTPTTASSNVTTTHSGHPNDRGISAANRSLSVASNDGSASVGGVFGDSDDSSDSEIGFNRNNNHVNGDDDNDDDDESIFGIGKLKRQDVNGISEFELLNESYGRLNKKSDYVVDLKRSDSDDARKGSDDDMRVSTDESTQSQRRNFLGARRQESYRNIRSLSMQPQVAKEDFDEDDNNKGSESDSESDNYGQEDTFAALKPAADTVTPRRLTRGDEGIERDLQNYTLSRSIIDEDAAKIEDKSRRSSGDTASLPSHHNTLETSAGGLHRRKLSRPISFVSGGKSHRSSYENVMPLSIGPGGNAALMETSQTMDSSQNVSNDLDEFDNSDHENSDEFLVNTPFEMLCPPSFSQFALLEIQPEQLLLIENEYLFADAGPTHLDAFLLNQDLDFGDHYTAKSSRHVDPTSVSAFCFPDGLKVRYIPKAGLAGATRMGWIGPVGDRCHVHVFTNGRGATDHGVAITIQWEMNLKKGERQVLSKSIFNRRKRRRASRKIQEWWRAQVQDRVLRDALEISGFPKHSPADLKAELTSSELKLLEKALKHSGERHLSQGAEGNVSKGYAARRQLKKKGISKKLNDALSRSPPGPRIDTLTVAEVTRAAMMRSPSAALLYDDVSRESTQSDDSPEIDEELKAAKGFSLRKGLSSRTNSKFSVLSVLSNRSLSSIPSSSPPSRPRRVLTRRPSKRVIELARESYETMKENDRMGSICVVEKCYTLIGCQPDEHVLLLGPLQKLIDAERREILALRQANNDMILVTLLKENATNDVDEERLLELEMKDRRQLIIKAMREKLRLTTRQALITYPRSQLEHVHGKIHYFETLIPQIPDCEVTKLPLPIPRVGKEWALAQFLLDIGPDSLVLCLKLMLLERSILVLGDNLQHVSLYACALIELLKPFEWASAFMPVLPRKMLDFVNCPVPFVAGVAVRHVAEIENDDRVLEAMSNGMSLLNLKTNTLQITTEKGISRMISLDPYLREKLKMMRTRLQHYLQESPNSSLRDFNLFVKSGLARRESLTLNSVCRVLEQHFSQFCGDLAVNDKAWTRYGTVDVKTNEFIFNPEWFLNPIRADNAFHEAIVHTQLFSGYVHERRQDRIEMHEILEGELGCFIAEWVYDKWIQRKRNNSLPRSHSLSPHPATSYL